LVRRMDHCQYPEGALYLAAFAQVSPTPARVEASSPLHQGLAVVECPRGVTRSGQIGISAVALLGLISPAPGSNSYAVPHSS